MKQWIDTLKNILENGQDAQTRNGIRRRIPHATFQHDCSKSFPVVTSKHVALRLVFEELNWFLSGSSDIRELEEKKVNIWSDYKRSNNWSVKAYKDPLNLFLDVARQRWDNTPVLQGFPGALHSLYQDMDYYTLDETQEEADLVGVDINQDVEYHGHDAGRIYGVQWRDWINQWGEHTDQISRLIHLLKTDPYSSNLLVNAWNAGELDHMALPPCHFAFICFVDVNPETQKQRLNLKWIQRSCDYYTGIPYNIASYAMLLHFLAYEVDMEVGMLYGDFTNVHLYESQFEAAREVISRGCFDQTTQLTLVDPPKETWLYGYKWSNLEFTGYKSHPALRVPLCP